MELSAWIETLIGFVIIFILFKAVKFHQLFKFWRNSFYTEIYSSFVEFLYRRNSLKRMSRSYWLSNNFGPHRIIFQLAKSTHGDIPQAYIIILLSSGIYLLQIKNHLGKMEESSNGTFFIIRKSQDKKTGKTLINRQKTENPIKQLNVFTHKWQALTGLEQTLNKIIVFNESNSLFLRSKKDDSITITSRKNIFKTIKSIHESQPHDLDADKIENIHRLLLNHIEPEAE